MSEEFKTFTEAARLYAKHSAVVDKMREAYNADIEKFLDALEERISSKVRDGEFKEEQKGKHYRSWWIEGDETEGDVPFVWIDNRPPSIVAPGMLQLTVAFDGDLTPYRAQIDVMQSKVPAGCKVQKAGDLFSVTISYGKDDPVSEAAEPILAVLVAPYEVQKSVQKGTKRKKQAVR